MSEDTVEKILASKKYGGVCPDTVRRVYEECRQKYKKTKEIEHAVREALHGITGAFMSAEDSGVCIASLGRWLESGDELQLEKALSCHTSTRERLPIGRMDAVFEKLLRGMPEESAVLDLACGIDPVYLAARGIRVKGMDISGEAAELINEAGKLLDGRCSCVCADLLCTDRIDTAGYDVTLLFKVLPLLERQRKGSAKEILRQLDSARIIVSFPTRTLGGRNVGMESHYAMFMQECLPEERCISSSFEEGNELFYILEYPE